MRSKQSLALLISLEYALLVISELKESTTIDLVYLQTKITNISKVNAYHLGSVKAVLTWVNRLVPLQINNRHM